MVNSFWQNVNKITNVHIENAQFLPALLKMAHLYQLKDLQGECEEYLARNITKENAVEAWTAARVSGSQKLRDMALMTIAKANIH